MVSGRWRINNGVLSCGTLRIAKMDYDTDPAVAVKEEIEKQMVDSLNAAPKEGEACDKEYCITCEKADFVDVDCHRELAEMNKCMKGGLCLWKPGKFTLRLTRGKGE